MKRKGIKELIETHPIKIFGSITILAFTCGIGGATWIFNNKWNEEKANLQTQLTYCDNKWSGQIVSLQNELSKWQNEYNKVNLTVSEKLQKAIHVMNTQMGGSIVARIQQSLTKYPNYRTIGILIVPGVLSGVPDYAKLRPDLLIAHRHAFDSNNDNLIVEAMNLYYQKNSNIKFLIFSESFLYESGKTEFKAIYRSI